MKNNLSLYLGLLMTLLPLWGISQNENSNTFYSSINLDGKMMLTTDLPGEVEFAYWEHDYGGIEVKVQTNPCDAAMLHLLKAEGRYEILAKNHEGIGLQLTAPAIQKGLVVKGREVEEKLSFKIFLPHYIAVAEQPQVVKVEEVLAINF